MSFQETLWKFLNSGLGLLVSSFFLTTLAGAFLTTWYKRESKKQEIRFLQLHEERAKAIKTFHDKAVEVKRALEVLPYLGKPNDTAPLEITPEEVNKKIEEFRVLSEKSKIYFRKELCDFIDSMSESYSEILPRMRSSGILGIAHGDDTDPEYKAKIGYIDFILHPLDRLIEILRREFRNLLGVE